VSTEKAPRPETARLRVVTEETPSVSLQTLIGEAAPRKGVLGRYLKWLIAAALLVAAGALAWFYFGQGAAYSYVTAKVVRGDLTVVVTATGTVQPIAKVDVSTAISGIVREVNVDYNSMVRKGEVLAELDTSTLSASVAGSKARLAAANANVARAKLAADAAQTTFERQATLHERGVVSVHAIEEAKQARDSNMAALQVAEAEVLVSQADLEQAATSLAWATITSPIDGVVLTRSVDEGSTVAASFQAPVLFSIAGDLREMELQVDVDEADIGNVAVGQAASFSVDAYRNRNFAAEIKSIRFVSETVNNVVTYKALLAVDNGDLSLRPGMTATADITVKEVGQALLVPNAALRYTPPTASESPGFLFFRAPDMSTVTTAEKPSGSRTVWVMRDKAPAAIDVEVGDSDGQSTQVLSGDLAEGDEVIIDAVSAN
jgi:HlyD family secretion protein